MITGIRAQNTLFGCQVTEMSFKVSHITGCGMHPPDWQLSVPCCCDLGTAAADGECVAEIKIRLSGLTYWGSNEKTSYQHLYKLQ